jgi:protein TonB
MEIKFVNADPQRGADRLGFAFFIAVAIHGMIIFGVGFTYLKSKSSTTSLAVTMALLPSDESPEDASFVAQTNQQGSGDQSDKTKQARTNRIPDYLATVLRDTQLLQQSATEQKVRHSTERAITSRQTSQLTKQQIATRGEQLSSDLENNDSPNLVSELSSLRARLDTQQQAYNRLPDILRLTTASARKAEHAAYLEYWINKVELTGNLYYPEQARQQKLFGELRLAVTVSPDGAVESIEIIRGSEHRLLDQAAVETVRRASPFEPFPEHMMNWDKIEIIQTWRYLPGNHMRAQ